MGMGMGMVMDKDMYTNTNTDMDTDTDTEVYLRSNVGSGDFVGRVSSCFLNVRALVT